MDQLYYLGGVNVNVFSDTQLVIEPFSAALWIGGWGMEIVNFTETIYPDLATVGINGRDGGTLDDGCYYIYMVANPDVGFVLSKSDNLSFPYGYRKLMYGVTVIGGKIAPTHCSAWPMPIVSLTNDTQVAAFFGPTNGLKPINLSKLVPTSSRFCTFRLVITGGPANVFLAGSGGGTGKKLWAYNEYGVRPNIGTRIEGGQTVWIETVCAPGVRVDVYLDAFHMTEVS